MSDVCPALLVTPLSTFFLELHRHYRRGVLPAAGGLFDQAGIFFDAMNTIESIRGADL